MTMLRCDSFDFYSTAQISRYWNTSFGATSIGAAVGRNGTNALHFDNEQDRASWTYPSNIVEGFHHFAMQWPSNYVFLTLIDNATAQLTFKVRSDRKIEVFRGTGSGTSLGTTSASLPTTGLSHIQIRWKIDDSTGVVVIKIDDTTVLNLTGQDTKNTANAYCTTETLGTDQGFNSGITGYIDDYIFCDTAGSVNNGFLGDKRVQWCPALAEGATSDYTPSTGTDNAALVDENPANDDTDYIESSTVGHIDYVTLSVSPTIPSGATVSAVAVVTTDKKTDGGTRTARHKIRFGSGPTVSNGAAFGPLTSYAIHKTIFEDTITVSEVNAPMQVGSEVMT
jgi:hypothetical protein